MCFKKVRAAMFPMTFYCFLCVSKTSEQPCLLCPSKVFYVFQKSQSSYVYYVLLLFSMCFKEVRAAIFPMSFYCFLCVSKKSEQLCLLCPSIVFYVFQKSHSSYLCYVLLGFSMCFKKVRAAMVTLSFYCFLCVSKNVKET